MAEPKINIDQIIRNLPSPTGLERMAVRDDVGDAKVIVNDYLKSYLPLSGGTITGNLEVNGDLTKGGDAVALATDLSNYLPLSGGTISGNLTVSGRSLFSDGTALLPSMSFASDPNTGFYRVGSDAVSVATGGIRNMTWYSDLTISIENDGTASVPALFWEPDINTGFWHPAPDTVAISNNGVETMRWGDDNNASLGKNSFESWDTDASVFQIGDLGALFSIPESSSTPITALSRNIYFDGTDLRLIDNGFGAIYSMIDGDHSFSGSESGGAGDVANFVGGLRISEGQGLFEFGTELLPSVTFRNDGDTGLWRGLFANTVQMSNGGIKNMTWYSDLTVSLNNDGTVTVPTLIWEPDYDTGFWHPAPDTVAISNNGIETMRWDDNNNVGIGGVPDAGTKLHLIDGSAGSVTAIASAQLAIESSSSANINLLSPATSTQSIFFGDQNNNQEAYIQYNHNTDTMDFFIKSSSYTSTMTMNGGNVGIDGAPTGSYKFEVLSGNSWFAGDVSALSFTDRTPFPETGYDALSEIRKIKSKDGKLDHATLPDFSRIQRTKAVKETIDGEEVETEEIEELRDIGASVSINVVAIQQLLDRVEQLENK